MIQFIRELHARTIQEQSLGPSQMASECGRQHTDTGPRWQQSFEKFTVYLKILRVPQTTGLGL